MSRYASATRRFLVASVLFGVITTTLIIVQAVLLTTIIVGVFTEQQDLSDVAGTVLLLGIVLALRVAGTYLSEWSALASSATAKSQLRQQVMSKAITLGPVWGSGKNSAQFATLITRGVDGLDAYFSRYLPQLVLAVLVPIGVGAVILSQDLLAAVIVVITLPLIPLFMVLIGMYTQRRVDRQWLVLRRLSGHFADVVAGMPTLKIFGRAKMQADSVKRVSNEYRKSTMGVLRISFLSALVLELLAMLSVALVAVSIGLRLVEGNMTLAAGLLVLILVPEVYLPLRLVGMHYHAAAEGLGAAQQLLDTLDLDEVQDGTEGNVPDLSVVPITFEHVSVSYPGREDPALDDFSSTLVPRQVNAIVGASGSGKSTLLACLERFVAPTSGQIMIGEVDIARFRLEALRERICLISQNPYLLPDSIARNVSFGRHTSEGDIRSALERVGLARLIDELPDGLDTVIGVGGRTLSVGQTRRVAIARALASQPELVLLDEPTASLDDESQRIVMQVIDELATTATVIVATHSADVARRASNVITLEVSGVSSGF